MNGGSRRGEEITINYIMFVLFFSAGGVGVVEGSILNLVGVHRRQMAAYLCIGMFT